MKRRIKIAAILILLTIVVWIWWAYWSSSRNQVPHQPATASTLNEVITHPVIFAENHFKGGIGVVLKTDPRTGLPTVMQVVSGSPAEKAGLRKDDVIAGINGTSTTGRPLAKIVDELRGFAGGQVSLTIQRTGSTNLEMTLRRSSWSGLGATYSPSNGPAFVLPVAPVAATASNNSPK